jgi:Ca2+-binding EF-hand superfamily protein
MAAAAGAGGGLTDAQRRVFTEVFEHVDANKDGFLVFEELKKAILAATELHGKKITERQAKEAAERALQDCDMNNVSSGAIQGAERKRTAAA